MSEVFEDGIVFFEVGHPVGMNDNVILVFFFIEAIDRRCFGRSVLLFGFRHNFQMSLMVFFNARQFASEEGSKESEWDIYG